MPTDKKIVKRNVKDSVFTNLFQDTKYIVELYKALHPEAGYVTEDMIEIVTLKNILTDSLYNDLGFMMDKRLIVLVEAQSTWTVNIILRGLMYLVQTYQDYIEKEELNIYSSKKLEIPKPELYVIYTGDKKVEEKEISLSEEYFGGEKMALDVRVKVITESREGDIINQYVMFTHILNDRVKEYGRTKKAIDETIKICKDRNILKEYLSNHESEVHDIMFSLYDDEQIFNAAMREHAKAARKEGIREGEMRGRMEGIKEGEMRGRMEGIDAMIANMRKAGISDEMIQNVANMTQRPIS